MSDMDDATKPRQKRRGRSILEGKGGHDRGYLVPPARIQAPDHISQYSRPWAMAILRFFLEQHGRNPDAPVIADALRDFCERCANPRFGPRPRARSQTPHEHLRNLLRVLFGDGLLEHVHEVGDGEYRIRDLERVRRLVETYYGRK